MLHGKTFTIRGGGCGLPRATSYEYYPGTELVKEQRREAIAAQGAFPAQPEIVTSYTGSFIINAKQIPVWQKRITTITSAGSTLTEEHTYDADDRVILHKDFNGYITTTVYSDMDKVVTETLPDLSTRITTKNSKGLVLSITGTAVVPQYFHYEPLADGSESKTVYTGQDLEAVLKISNLRFEQASAYSSIGRS